MNAASDIIVAPASALGGAIAIIRVSGTGAVECVAKVFNGAPLAAAKGYTAHYGHIGDGCRVIDDVVVTVFRAPHSYTGEDSVEIAHHGSRVISAEIIETLIGAGARMAAAGEFSQRAFLAGKLDLSQAEAVADLIASSSRGGAQLASTQMRGGYSAELGELRARLLTLASLLELELDFSEEDVEFADRAKIARLTSEIHGKVNHLKESFRTGNAIKNGVCVAIVGRPNVGKSTLLNRLVGDDRAMVSDVAGTTRDTIEAATEIDGVLFRFVDTAGLHSTTDRLEQMGIERAERAIAQAQIVVLMNEPDGEPMAVNINADQRLIKVVNKIDKYPTTPLLAGAIAISAKRGDGVEQLRTALRECVDTSAAFRGEAVVSNMRHYEALRRADEALQRTEEGLRNHLSGDLLSEEIRSVLAAIGEITGEITTPEILESIFSKFCIGK